MLKYFTFFYTVIISTLLVSIHVQAVEVNDIYQAQVVVDSQSNNIRSSAVKQAMRNVLIKVSGTEQVNENAILREALNNPNSYLLQYRYDSVNDNRLLIVDFDEAKINQLLNSAQQPIWGKFRPQVLLWLLEEDGLVRRIHSSSDDYEIGQQIKKLAKSRGLPIIQPIMDFDDINRISVAELWGRFIEPVNLAAQRYSPEKNVIIRVSKDSFGQNKKCTLCDKNAYVIDWSIIEDQKQTFSQPYQGINSDVLITQLMEDLTAHIYQQYALEVTSDNEVFIDINNIKGLTDYANVANFLSTLSSIQQITLTEVNEKYYRFRLIIMGSESTLLSSFKLSNKLAPYVDAFTGNSDSHIPVFSWQSR